MPSILKKKIRLPFVRILSKLHSAPHSAELAAFTAVYKTVFYICKIILYFVLSGLMRKFGIEHISTEWRLFVDSSSSSLKGVLLHNGNNYPSIPIIHSVHLKESYESVKLILQKVVACAAFALRWFRSYGTRP